MGSLKLLLAAIVAVVVLGAAPASAAVPVLVVDGRGFGHGVGMAQDGALWMGRGGADLGRILGHFYPGAELGTASGPVRVEVLVAPEAVLTFPAGGEVRGTGSGFPLRVGPGGAVRVRRDGAGFRVAPVGVRAQAAGRAQLLPIPGPPPPGPSTTTTTLLPRPGRPAPPPTTTPTTRPPATTTTTSPERVSSRSVRAVPARGDVVGVPARSARYRGVVDVVPGASGLRLVNEVDVEQYLRGMGEVRDPSWPAASLQAQAVAARTYALRAMRASGELCDTQRCQVYLGQQAEYAAMDRAVRATARQVLTFGGGFAAAVYSANGGGVSATPSEGFGTSDAAYPYLKASPYETKDPDPWQVRIALSDLAGRLSYPGTIESVTVATTGPSGRPTSVAVVGSAGRREVPAKQVQAALGLRSTKWAVRTELGVAPPPPPAAEVIQALPDEAAPSREREREVVAQSATADPERGSGGVPWKAPALVVLTLLAAGAGVMALRRDR